MKDKVKTIAVLSVCFCSFPANADIFKCTDADGSVSYNQIPCPDPKTENGATASAQDCAHANQFAHATARLMRGGASSSDVFDRYGGPDVVSRSTMSIINYVYGYRSSDDISSERIGALADAECRARSLGDVRCEALPMSYQNSIGGCDKPANIVANDEVTEVRTDDAIERCKKPYRDQIDAIEAQMFRGYDVSLAEQYKEELRSLTQRMRQCER